MKKKISFILLLIAASVGLWFWGYHHHQNMDNIPSKSIAAQMDTEEIERILYGLQSDQTDENSAEYGTCMTESYTDRMEEGSDYSESGYQVEVLAAKFPADELEASLEEATESIKEQYENYVSYSSILPGYWTKKFDSRDEACDYLKYEAVKQFSWDLQEVDTALSVSGNENGDVFFVTLETSYIEDDIRLQFFTNIYTKKYEHEMIFGSITTESVKFTEDFCTAESGRQYHIIESSALESGYYTMDGYLVDDGIVYKLHISYLEKDAVRAKELMQQWASQF